MFFRKSLTCLLLLLPILCGAVLWPGCERGEVAVPSPSASSPPSTREVTDLAGRTVTLPATVNRFVLMRGMGLYDLAALLGDDIETKMVGWDSSLKASDRDAYDKFMERLPGLKKVPMLGDSLREGVSAEAVLALQPDLIIAGTYMIGQASSLEKLEQAGVPILYLSSDDPVRDPQRSILLLGEAFNKQERAKQIADWVDRELAAVLEPMSALTGPVPSIYLEAGTYGAEKYGNTFGSNLLKQRVHWGSLLSQLRCKNIAADISGPHGMGVIQPEHLLTENPDVIVITGACWTAFPESLRLGYSADEDAAREKLKQYAGREGWPDLQAVQNQRIYGLNTRLGSHVTSFVAAQQLAQWLYPKEFAQLDPRLRLQEFHEQFMPIRFTGTWMVEPKAP